MKFFTLFAALVATTSASAIPEKRWGWPKCLSQSFADKTIAQFITILQHPDIPAANATAQALLDSSFKETSDSILSLEGLPVCYIHPCEASTTDASNSLADHLSVAR